MTREERYERDVYQRFGHVNGERLETLDRYCTVTQDDDGDHWHATYETLAEAATGLEHEICGERSWWPVVVVDLDTGQEFSAGTRVIVTLSPQRVPA